MDMAYKVAWTRNSLFVRSRIRRLCMFRGSLKVIAQAAGRCRLCKTTMGPLDGKKEPGLTDGKND